MKKILLSCLASIALVAGCSSSENELENSAAAVDVQMNEQALTAADVPKIDVNKAVKSGENINDFAFDFARKLDDSQSYVFSPYSLHTALTMTAFGAAGNTYDEMKEVLNLGGDNQKAAEEFGALSLNLRFDGQTETSKFEIANRLWIDNSIEIVPKFSEGMDKYYKAPLQIVDFKNYPEEVRKIINTWVSNVTSDMIKDLIPNGKITSDTAFVIVNAIHFDGKWNSKFEKEKTTTEKFNTGSSEIDVDMMHQTTHVHWMESTDNEYSAIVMPYQGSKFDMVFILPNNVNGISKVMKSLKSNDIDQIMKADMADVDISLPKFKVETDIDDGDTVLKSLGMKSAFEGNADFSNMVSNYPILISAVIHKAVIEVDEEGTKAAAATAVIGEKNALVIDGKKFKADHPFGFALVHHDSQTILFAGQYLGK